NLGHLLCLGLVLVGNIEFDRARRPLREVLVAVDCAARDVDIITGLHRTGRLAPDSEGNFPSCTAHHWSPGWRWNWLPAPARITTLYRRTTRDRSFANGIRK